MKKMKLDLDALQVDTFDTSAEAGGERGTVHGNHAVCCCCCCCPCCCSGAASCGGTCDASACNGSCVASCNGSCDVSCNGTCWDWTCQGSCWGSCDPWGCGGSYDFQRICQPEIQHY